MSTERRRAPERVRSVAVPPETARPIDQLHLLASSRATRLAGSVDPLRRDVHANRRADPIPARPDPARGRAARPPARSSGAGAATRRRLRNAASALLVERRSAPAARPPSGPGSRPDLVASETTAVGPMRAATSPAPTTDAGQGRAPAPGARDRPLHAEAQARPRRLPAGRPRPASARSRRTAWTARSVAGQLRLAAPAAIEVLERGDGLGAALGPLGEAEAARPDAVEQPVGRPIIGPPPPGRSRACRPHRTPRRSGDRPRAECAASAARSGDATSPCPSRTSSSSAVSWSDRPWR